MKAKILFSTLALGAAFVACNNEDIMVNETLDTNEIVGAKLLGEGLAMNIGAEGTDSRATANAWENGDVAGVAWVADGDASADQTGVVLGDVEATVWANHFYQYNEGAWNTRSNIYEGWHFAYLPYQHQSKAQQLVVEVNAKPMTKEDHQADVMDNAPKISAAEFLNEDVVDYTNGTIDVVYDIQRYVNVIKPKLLISEDFTGHKDLNTIPITGITVKESRNDKQLFVNSVKINPALLPQIQYKKYPAGHAKAGQYILVDGKKQYDKEATLALLNQANLYGKGAIANATFSTSETTTINGEYYVLNGDKTVRMFLAPTRNYMAGVGTLSFTVDVTGGHFTVAYTTPVVGKSLTETQKTNNAAIQKMVDLLNGTFENASGETRSLRTINTEDGALQAAQTIEMALSLENFTADYIIEDIEDWNGSVTLANALNEEKPVFHLAKDAKVEFTDEMLAPENGVTVVGDASKTSKLIINGDLTWNNDVKINRKDNVFVEVKAGKSLSLEATVLQPYRIYNYGVIYADGLSTVGANGYNVLEYNNRIEIEYGAYVYPAKSGLSGDNIIAYNVDGSESAAKINTLVATTGNKNGHAGVNTLIIANDVELNLNKTDKDNEDDDRYNGDIIDGSVLADMTNVAIEMNGGSIIAALNKVKNVHNVTIKGGVNTIKDVDVMGTLDVEAGSVTIDATEYTVEKTVGGNKVYEKVKNAADINAITVDKNGTLNVTVDTYTSDIVNNGTINVTDPYALCYANSIEQSGSQSGKIVQGSIDLAAAIAAGGEITLMKDETLTEALTVTNSVSIDLNGKTLTTSTTGTKNDIEIQAGGKLTVENGNVKTNATAFQTKNGGELVLNNCTVTTNGTDKWNAVGANTGKLTINGGKFVTNGGVDDSYAIGIVNAEANINDAEVSGRGAIAVHQTTGKAKLTINGGTYNGSTYYGIFVNGGEVNFENATIEGTTADIYVAKESKINSETKAAASMIDL